jgi:hypothetical protein
LQSRFSGGLRAIEHLFRKFGMSNYSEGGALAQPFLFSAPPQAAREGYLNSYRDDSWPEVSAKHKKL